MLQADLLFSMGSHFQCTLTNRPMAVSAHVSIPVSIPVLVFVMFHYLASAESCLTRMRVLCPPSVPYTTAASFDGSKCTN